MVEPVVADVGTVNDVEDSPEPVKKHKIVKRNIERNYTVLLDNTIFRVQMVEILKFPVLEYNILSCRLLISC